MVKKNTVLDRTWRARERGARQNLPGYEIFRPDEIDGLQEDASELPRTDSVAAITGVVDRVVASIIADAEQAQSVEYGWSEQIGSGLRFGGESDFVRIGPWAVCIDPGESEPMLLGRVMLAIVEDDENLLPPGFTFDGTYSQV